MNRYLQICCVLSLLMSLSFLLGCGKSADEPTDWVVDEQPVTPVEPEPIFADVSEATLSLKLQPGDHFPLRKVVEQELVQSSPSGQPTVARSRLELMFAISVLAVEEGRTKLRLRYDRVNYQHNVADEHVEYDSERPPFSLPMAVRPYHDMVGDGFAFWLGTNNQIVEVDGFAEFIERCLANVNPEQRPQVILGIEAGTDGESGIANIVDNSIGLLPPMKKQTQGDSWERMQPVQRPVPMMINNTFTLKELTQDYAVIDIRGAITPSTSMSAVEAGNGVRITVTGGETGGSSVIFRETGLPKESTVVRKIDMNVMLTGGIQFQQTKKVTTTIEAFPVSSNPPTIIGGRTNQNTRIQPVGHEVLVR